MIGISCGLPTSGMVTQVSAHGHPALHPVLLELVVHGDDEPVGS